MTSLARIAPGAHRWHRALLSLGATALIWLAVALVFAGQGYLIALYRQQPQSWWLSLGYSIAMFSIWVLLTPLVIAMARRVARLRIAKFWRGLILIAGLPAVTAAHVWCFALIYWPVFSEGGRITSRWQMGERMFLPNLDTDTLFYAALVGFALLRRERADVPQLRQPPAEPDLVIRSRGGCRVIALSSIDWIEAAGNYCEVHAGRATSLIEMSMTMLAERLPADAFARIHRSCIVRLDRIAEVRGTGHGDGIVRLADGTELRLSRRYRRAFQTRFAALR